MGIDKPGQGEPTRVLTPEELKAQEEAAMYAKYAELANYFETERAPIIPETKRESGPEVAELEKMFEDFESNHNIDELLAITDLDQKDAANHPLRAPANKDRAIIFDKLKKIKNETNISDEEKDRLQAKYKIINQAIGAINNGKVDHTR